MKWLDDAQEFVWMDAIKIGNRIYHASCHAEARMGVTAPAEQYGTPEPVLGKRKAEVINHSYYKSTKLLLTLC